MQRFLTAFTKILKFRSSGSKVNQSASTLIDKMSKSAFYAVRKGKQTGVFNTWDECKDHVTGVSGAQYKKFKTENEAWNYTLDLQNIDFDSPLAENDSATTPRNSQETITTSGKCQTPKNAKGSRRTGFISIDELPTMSTGPLVTVGESKRHGKRQRATPYDRSAAKQRFQKTPTSKNVQQGKPQQFKNKPTKPIDPTRPTVYTDGACQKNGRKNARAGIGVYWGPNNELNVSEALPGRPTNNRAEIHAAVRALQQAREQGLHEINLATDSYFLINGITSWIHKWKRNGWTLSTGEPVINKDDFIALEAAAEGIDVNWVHVRGHRGNEGNEAADKLASAATKRC